MSKSKYGKVNSKFRKYFKHLDKEEGPEVDKIEFTEEELEELKKREDNE